jgi:putative RecB family exonuclease
MKLIEIRDHVSYSSISKYLLCPKRWYYDYVIAPDKPVKSLALDIGSAYHNAMEALYTTGEFDKGKLVLEELASENGRFAQKEISAVSLCYGNYYNEIYPKYQTRVERIELKDRVEIPGVDVPLEYRMDLITTDGVIVDHKTVGRMKPDISYSLQFDLYSYAYYKQYGVMPRGVEYHNAYKSNGKVEVISKIPTISEMLKAVDTAAGVVKSIENDLFYPKCSKACNYCPHKEMCDREYGLI